MRIVLDTNVLVTGNPRHYPARCRGRVNVLSPATFLESFRKPEDP